MIGKTVGIVGVGIISVITLAGCGGSGSLNAARASISQLSASASALANTVQSIEAVPPPTVTHVVTPTVTVTTTYTPQPVTAFAGDGTYLVGTDVKPGTYRSAPPVSGNCYSEVDSKSGILNNNNTSGQTILTIPSSAYSIRVQGCSDFTAV